ncbi:MAG: hypothetical protein JSS51_13415 [Planctomycetes bacterium]|nr:hypothetical protein [Planctomycetota bacterium]
MSGRVCYVARADRGSRIESLRLVGARSDELWAVPLEVPGDSADAELFDERAIASAAEWVRSRTVGGKSKSGELAFVCLDSDGFGAGWITSPSTEAGVVTSVALAGVGSEEVGSAVGPGLGFFLPSGAEAGVQALAVASEPDIKPVKGKTEAPAPADATTALRVPVLAGADAPVRLLLDALDERGIAVNAVTTIWHAMARVWGDTSSDRTNVITEDSGVVAIILVDPRGKLIWCWSAKGELLAGGSMRLATPPQVGRAPIPTTADAARLTNDWMAWGSQLGVVPRRVACIAADDPVGVGEDSASFHAGQFGAKLAGAWGGAGVDLVLDNDPVGVTLSRFATAIADTKPDESAVSGIELLSNRPGRVHRRMHAWVAAGIGGAALLIGGVAWKLRTSETKLSEATQNEGTRWRSVVAAAYPNLMKLSGDVDLEGELSKIKTRYEQERERNKIEPQRPIVQELETLSMALADPEVELESIAFSGGLTGSVIITILVPDIKQGESVFKAITTIGGSNIESWSQPSFTLAGAKTKAVFTGKWKTAKAGGTATPASGSAPAKPAPRPATPTQRAVTPNGVPANTKAVPGAQSPAPTQQPDTGLSGSTPLPVKPAETKPESKPLPAQQPQSDPSETGTAMPPRESPAVAPGSSPPVPPPPSNPGGVR